MPLYDYFNTTNQTSPHFERHENFVTAIKEPTCAWVETLAYEDRCDYVQTSGTCGGDVFIFNYIELLYCHFPLFSENHPELCVLLLLLVCIYFFLTLAISADHFFCPSLKVLSNLMHLNENVAGVTLLAFGNSAPDVLTGITGFAGSRNTLYSDLFGSLIFVVYVVAGSIVTMVPFDVNPTCFLRDTSFLLLDVVLIDYVLSHQDGIRLRHCLFILALYLYYIIVVIVDNYLETKSKKEIRKTHNVIISPVTYPHLQDDDIEEIVDTPLQKPQKLTPFATTMVLLTKKNFMKLLQRRKSNEGSISADVQPDTGLNEITEINDGPSVSGNNQRTNNQRTIICTCPEILIQFFKTINPIDADEWQQNNLFMRMTQLAAVPVLLCLRLAIPVVDYELPNHGWSKLLNCIQLVTLPMLLNFFLNGLYSFTSMVVFICIGAVALPFAIFLLWRTKIDKTPRHFELLSILGTLGSIYVIYSVASEIINIMQVIGMVTNRTNSFLGCTLLAWGNSVGDLITNVVLARQGYQRMGYAACFGGPLFYSTVLIGSLFLQQVIHSPDRVYFAYKGTLGENTTIFLILGLFCLLYAGIITNFTLRRSIGIFMLSLYILYVIFATLGEFEVTHPYGSDHKLDVQEDPTDI